MAKTSFDFKSIRCEHHHDYLTHPSCIFKMMAEGIDKPQWYKDATIGYLDIETSNLNPTFGVMFSWAIQDKDGAIHSDMMSVSKGDFHWSVQDSRVVRNLVKQIANYNIIITFYGSRFDIPFLRSRAMKWGCLFPGYGSVLQLDMYYVCRSKLNLHRGSLKAVSRFLGIEGKDDIEPDLWVKALFGHKESIDLIHEHNVWDVKVLQEVHKRMEPYIKGTRTSL